MRLPINNAGIHGTAQFIRNTFLLETKVFVPSPYRHDEEDAARPSVSQTAAVTRPHLQFHIVDYHARTKKVPVLLLLIRLEFGQEVRNVVGFYPRIAANSLF